MAGIEQQEEAEAMSQRSTGIALGLPSLLSEREVRVLAPGCKSRQLIVDNVGVGSDCPVSVQSMCTTVIGDVDATLQQIAELTAAGCQIVRVAVPSTANGTGAAREADLTVASGNGKGQIILNGQVIRTVSKSQIVQMLIEEVMRIADGMRADGAASGEPLVSLG